MEKRHIETKNGKIQVWFAQQGPKLAVYHHGVPKPRELSTAELAAFAKHGYSVAAIVRPGYLESAASPAPANMADIAEITAAVIGELGFERYLAVGFSGGGPRALANVALAPMATAVILVGSVAAPNLDFDYFGVMPDDEREFMEAVRDNGRGLLPQFEKWAAATPEFDHGTVGWVDDEISMLTPWGYDLADVARPVVLLASKDDQNVPYSHSQWLNGKLATSRLIEIPGSDHDALMSGATLDMALNLLAE